MKKVWALVLSLAMILTLASFPTFAAESEKLDLAAIATITTTATAGSDENNTVSVGKLYDGVTDDSASIWMDPWNSSISPVLTFELNGLYSLDKIVMYVGNNKAPKGIKVEVAGNDGVYTTVKDEEISSEQSNSYWAPIAVTFEGLNLTGVRYVRFTLTKVDSYNTRVREVEMYGAMESALPSPVKIVDVSASLAPYQQTLPIHASDGDTGSMFAAQGKGYITFELDKWYDLSTFDITFGSPSWGGTDMTPKAFNVSVSSDGTNFTQAYTYSAEAGLGGGLQSLTAQSFDTDVAKTAKYVRVEITTQASWIWSIAEFSAIGTALDITAEEYTVKYVDIFGNEVSTAKAGSAIVGKTVTETAPAVTGYSVTGNGKQQLAISENAEENVLTFVYLKDDLASATNYKDKLTIKDGKLCVTSGASEEERKVAKELGIETKDPITFTKQGELKIGSEVTANGENFYVIGGNEVGKAISSDTQTVILLTKYCLKKENGEITLKQDTSVAYNSCAFSSRNYWNSAEGIAYPDTDGKYPDLNNEKKYPIGNETSIITKAKEYGKSLNVEGRLMTVEEIVKLGGSISESSTSECPNYITNGQKYWLGSAYDQGYVWGVYSDDENNIKSLSYDSYGTASGGGGFGLRPVIEVPVSSIN